MKRYFVEIDGVRIEVAKEVNDELRANTGASRRERYVIEELSKKYESSLEYLISIGVHIEQHITCLPQPSPEEQLISKIKFRNLHAAINQLSKIERKIIIMIFFYEMTESDAAMILDTSQQYISKVKITAIKKLRKIFS